MKIMKISRRSLLLLGATIIAALYPGPAHAAASRTSPTELAQKAAENQIRNLLEPVLEKYCHIDNNTLNACKLLTVTVLVDYENREESAPGFDDIDPRSASRLVPSSAKVKLLIDEKVGPVSRAKLLDLMQQYLDTLEFPVKIETKLAAFPQPLGSAGKVASLREQITKRFHAAIEDLFRQFCPEQCMLADFELKTDPVNPEEAQYGQSGEFLEEGGTAIRIRDISATLLLDQDLLPEERANIFEMARLKTSIFKNVNFNTKVIKFPQPRFDANGNLIGNRLGRGLSATGTNTSNTNSTNSTNNSTTQSQKESRNSESRSTQNNATTDSRQSDEKNSVSESSRSQELQDRKERYERYETIERVENGDAVQKELRTFRIYGIIFAFSVLTLLTFLVLANRKRLDGPGSILHRFSQAFANDPVQAAPAAAPMAPTRLDTPGALADRQASVAKRYEIERLVEELIAVYAEHPKVAKAVFSRVLAEEGVEITAQYLHIFGESVVVDMLKDPSLQGEVTELLEFYAKNTIEITDDDKLELLRRIHNRTIAGKLLVLGNRSSNLFDFLTDMDGLQILELIRNESLTVKAIVLTQCDHQKRGTIFQQLDEETRMKLLTELSRIDYLPRDYIYNVAVALKRKRNENPKLNTEALPGSEVLVNLLERTGAKMQRSVIQNLEAANPESSRMIKHKLVSIETLKYLRDGQLLEVVLSLRHDELLQFLKGAPDDIREAIFAKSPKDLVSELEDELVNIHSLNREAYQNVERKVINRIKVMANDGLINIAETNERMFAEMQQAAQAAAMEAGDSGARKAVA